MDGLLLGEAVDAAVVIVFDGAVAFAAGVEDGGHVAAQFCATGCVDYRDLINGCAAHGSGRRGGSGRPRGSGSGHVHFEDEVLKQVGDGEIRKLGGVKEENESGVELIYVMVQGKTRRRRSVVTGLSPRPNQLRGACVGIGPTTPCATIYGIHHIL